MRDLTPPACSLCRAGFGHRAGCFPDQEDCWFLVPLRNDGEHEIVVDQAGCHDEHVEQLVRLDHAWPEDGLVQEVEHGPHAVKYAAKHDGRKLAVREDADNFEIAEDRTPPIAR